MKTIRLTLGISLLALSTITTSCNKTNRNNAAEVVQQNNLAESAFHDFAFMAEQISKGPQFFKTFNANCSTLTYDTLGTDIHATIDYGVSDCICNDGKIRKGQIFISYPINYTSTGSLFETALADYSVNGNSVEGSAAVTKIASDIYTCIWKASIVAENGLDKMTFTSTKTKTFIENSNSPNVLAGNNYSFIGSSSGTTWRGEEYNIIISTPLLVQSGCRSVKSGLTTVTSSYFKGEATVDYGNGDCDTKAILKYGKKEVELHL